MSKLFAEDFYIYSTDLTNFVLFAVDLMKLLLLSVIEGTRLVIVMVNDFLGDGLKIYKIEKIIKGMLRIEHNKIRKQIRAFLLLLSFP